MRSPGSSDVHSYTRGLPPQPPPEAPRFSAVDESTSWASNVHLPHTRTTSFILAVRRPCRSAIPLLLGRRAEVSPRDRPPPPVFVLVRATGEPPALQEGVCFVSHRAWTRPPGHLRAETDEFDHSIGLDGQNRPFARRSAPFPIAFAWHTLCYADDDVARNASPIRKSTDDRRGTDRYLLAALAGVTERRKASISALRQQKASFLLQG